MKRLLSVLIFLSLSLFLIFSFSYKVTADITTEIHSFYFRYTNNYGYSGFLFEGLQSSNINIGISSTDNGGKDQVWVSSYPSEYDACYIKWVDNEPVKLGTEDVTLFSDGLTNYGIFFTLQAHNADEIFSNYVRIYYKDYAKDYANSDKDIILIGKSYLEVSSDKKNVFVYLDLGHAEEATTITVDADEGFLMYDHLIDNTIKIKRYSKLSDLPDPEKDKMIFDGWYSDSEFKSKYDFDNPFYDEVASLYAKYIDAYKIEDVSITFDMLEIGEIISFDSETLKVSPQLKFNMGSEYYNIFQSFDGIDMIWYDFSTDQIMNDVKFETSKEYGIMFYLVANEGCYFDDNVKVSVNGLNVLGTVKVGNKDTNCIKLLRSNEIVQIYCAFTPHSINLDINEGKIKKDLFPAILTEGSILNLDKIDKDTVTPPTGKVFDAYLINDVRYESGTVYNLTEDINIKLLWKDKPIYNKNVSTKGVYTISVDNELKFAIDEDYNLFSGNVYVDNILIDSSKYSATSGSTIITLLDSYLNTLTKGSHELKVEFEEGYVVSSFEVCQSENITEPDESNKYVTIILIVSGVVLVSTGFSLTLIFVKKKRRIKSI